jgi:hypothetical protein
MLRSPIIATPHPRSTILSGYLKDEDAGEEHALAKIDVCVVANSTSL